MFSHYSDLKENDLAEKILKEAILMIETDVEAQLMLANHYLKTDNLETCSQLCNHMIRNVSDLNEEILVVIIFISFIKSSQVSSG